VIGRASFVLLASVAMIGCQTQPADLELPPDLVLPLPRSCDLAAVRLGFTDRSDRPPACELPTGQWVALSCAIHDQINDPSYNPTYDESGDIVDGPPLPEYQVSDLDCDFASDAKNEAKCRFGLALPGEAEGARQVEVAFENHYSRHDTAVSHSEYVRWSLRGDCTPEPSSQ